MGLVFHREEWNRLTGCAESFCTYDDYNWDWSLQHVLSLKRCFSSLPAKTIIAVAPRVFHVGECGVHHKGRDCFDLSVTKKVQTLLEESRDSLFPESVMEIRTIKRNSKMPKVNGGWSDKRDHQLCLRHVNNSLISDLLPSSFKVNNVSQSSPPIIASDSELKKFLSSIYEHSTET